MWEYVFFPFLFPWDLFATMTLLYNSLFNLGVWFLSPLLAEFFQVKLPQSLPSPYYIHQKMLRFKSFCPPLSFLFLLSSACVSLPLLISKSLFCILDLLNIIAFQSVKRFPLKINKDNVYFWPKDPNYENTNIIQNLALDKTLQ